jgi:hypothetical protein
VVGDLGFGECRRAVATEGWCPSQEQREGDALNLLMLMLQRLQEASIYIEEILSGLLSNLSLPSLF